MDQLLETSKLPMLPLTKKVFKPKHPNVPLLSTYSTSPPLEFWEKIPKVTWEEGRKVKSPINATALFAEASRINYPDMATVMEIVNDVKYGCDIVCRGENLCPSVSSNAPSAYEHGEKITDAIVDGLHKRIMFGPMDEHEIPFESIKVNGMMVKLKPDNSARIILNMSQGFPFNVNDGIDNDQFEVYMSSTVRWLRAIHMAGRGCFLTKLDWKVKILGFGNMR